MEDGQSVKDGLSQTASMHQIFRRKQKRKIHRIWRPLWKYVHSIFSVNKSHILIENKRWKETYFEKKGIGKGRKNCLLLCLSLTLALSHWVWSNCGSKSKCMHFSCYIFMAWHAIKHFLQMKRNPHFKIMIWSTSTVQVNWAQSERRFNRFFWKVLYLNIR